MDRLTLIDANKREDGSCEIVMQTHMAYPFFGRKIVVDVDDVMMERIRALVVVDDRMASVPAGDNHDKPSKAQV